MVSHWESRPQPNVQGEERSQQHDARRLGRRTASASSNPSDDPAGDSRNQPNRKAPDHHREGKRHPGLSVAVAIQNRAEDPIAHGGHNRLGDDSRDRSGKLVGSKKIHRDDQFGQVAEGDFGEIAREFVCKQK